MKKSFNIFQFLIGVLLFVSCDNKNQAVKEEDHHEEHSEHENVNTTTLTAEQIKSIKLQLGTIEQKQLTASLKANGILKVPNQNKASITSLYGGVIKSILVQPGNLVKKGQTIATITNPQFIILQEEYLSSEAKIKYAQLEYYRQKELSSGNAGALKNYQLSETELQNLKTRKASIKKQLELIGINTSRLNNDNMSTVVAITSPTNGAVSNVMVNIGSNIDINTPIAEVVDNSQLHLDLYVYEKDLPKIKVGQTIHFTLTNNPGREYDAEIFGIGNTFEDATKALSVHAKVKGNKTGLIDGMNITALVSLENAIVPAVPTDAIVNYQGQDYIYIVSKAKNLEENHADPKSTKHEEHQHEEAEKPFEESTTFERIPVRKGTTDIGYSEITLLKEIPANTKIVTKGAFFILAKQTNSGEHEH